MKHAFAFGGISLSDTIYGRRVFKFIMQGGLLMFAVVSVLVFVPLFNFQKKKHDLTHVALMF